MSCKQFWLLPIRRRQGRFYQSLQHNRTESFILHLSHFHSHLRPLIHIELCASYCTLFPFPFPFTTLLPTSVFGMTANILTENISLAIHLCSSVSILKTHYLAFAEIRCFEFIKVFYLILVSQFFLFFFMKYKPKTFGGCRKRERKSSKKYGIMEKWN